MEAIRWLFLIYVTDFCLCAERLKNFGSPSMDELWEIDEEKTSNASRSTRRFSMDEETTSNASRSTRRSDGSKPDSAKSSKRSSSPLKRFGRRSSWSGGSSSASSSSNGSFSWPWKNVPQLESETPAPQPHQYHLPPRPQHAQQKFQSSTHSFSRQSSWSSSKSHTQHQKGRQSQQSSEFDLKQSEYPDMHIRQTPWSPSQPQTPSESNFGQMSCSSSQPETPSVPNFRETSCSSSQSETPSVSHFRKSSYSSSQPETPSLSNFGQTSCSSSQPETPSVSNFGQTSYSSSQPETPSVSNFGQTSCSSSQSETPSVSHFRKSSYSSSQPETPSVSNFGQPSCSSSQPETPSVSNFGQPSCSSSQPETPSESNVTQPSCSSSQPETSSKAYSRQQSWSSSQPQIRKKSQFSLSQIRLQPEMRRLSQDTLESPFPQPENLSQSHYQQHSKLSPKSHYRQHSELPAQSHYQNQSDFPPSHYRRHSEFSSESYVQGQQSQISSSHSRPQPGNRSQLPAPSLENERPPDIQAYQLQPLKPPSPLKNVTRIHPMAHVKKSGKRFLEIFRRNPKATFHSQDNSPISQISREAHPLSNNPGGEPLEKIPEPLAENPDPPPSIPEPLALKPLPQVVEPCKVYVTDPFEPSPVLHSSFLPHVKLTKLPAFVPHSKKLEAECPPPSPNAPDDKLSLQPSNATPRGSLKPPQSVRSFFKLSSSTKNSSSSQSPKDKVSSSSKSSKNKGSRQSSSPSSSQSIIDEEPLGEHNGYSVKLTEYPKEVEKNVIFEEDCRFRKCWLHICVEAGYVDRVKELIDKGSKVDPMDRMKNTPLFYLFSESHKHTTEEQRVAMCQILLTAGADPTHVNAMGQTILRFICDEDSVGFGGKANSELASAFFKAKGDVCATEITTGRTALHYAVDSDYEEMVYLLCNQPGVDVHKPDAKWESPVDLAIKYENKDILRKLLQTNLTKSIAEIQEENQLI